MVSDEQARREAAAARKKRRRSGLGDSSGEGASAMMPNPLMHRALLGNGWSNPQREDRKRYEEILVRECR